VARTFQNIRLFPELTARDNVLVGQHLRRHPSLLARLLMLGSAREEALAAREKAGALLARVGLPGRIDEQARHLSYGEQRRVEIARALASEPSLLLLDEPTAGMNPVEVQGVAKLIRQVAAEALGAAGGAQRAALMDVCDRSPCSTSARSPRGRRQRWRRIRRDHHWEASDDAEGPAAQVDLHSAESRRCAACRSTSQGGCR
jgi:hypothetical protein